MSFRSQPIPFIERVKDIISNIFTNNIGNRQIEIILFQILTGMLWWSILSISQQSFNITNWPIHLRTLLNLGWVYLFIILFIGLFVDTITVRRLLDYIFFPIEFIINLIIEIFVKWIAQKVDGFVKWLIYFVWNNIISKILSVIAIVLGVIIIGLVATGVTIGGLLLLGLAIAIALAIVIAILYSYYKHYEEETTEIIKKIINDILCGIRGVVKSIKGIPVAIVNTLKFFILDRMKAISDDQRIQALLFQLTLFFWSYAILVYVTGIYDPNLWPILLLIPWALVFVILQILFITLIWMKDSSYTFEQMLSFMFKPLYWLIYPWEWLLEWVENEIPCECDES